MDDDRVDLSPLDPTRNADRFARAVGRIMAGAAPALVRRRARVTPIGAVARWWRPTLALAAALTLAAVGVLVEVQDTTATTEPQSAGVAEALGIPTAMAPWLTAEGPPTAAQVFQAFQEVQ
jgi:hypothetical protein